MLTLRGEHINLRALEPDDLDFLYELENNPEVWEISGTTAPYSRFLLKQYLENAHRDIYEVKQLRLCICDQDGTALGLVDLFEFDPKNRRAGLGIVVLDEERRNKGIGSEAVQVVLDYAFKVLDLRQVYANVLEENLRSIHLFKKLGFEQVGIKKDWILSEGNYKNEILFQKLQT
ncbi:GNAT family N-acetyltransferase [Pseudozobellia thermophila]|uniref:Diamine N-acetyltransferase n=1 Tax=Pseudozobellia thermophila TaxID=192903 RepID=A0A1M6FBQ3_9FLAO|nr:GNAT family N-acetyltransferase [Pseudozobellia thermophila]SHI95140.1 diamine N-acetyltransferase [Pseudozobellia thermophila]